MAAPIGIQHWPWRGARPSAALRRGLAGFAAACALLAGAGAGWAGAAPCAATEGGRTAANTADTVPSVDLLRLDPAADYPAWRAALGWEDRRPFSDSARRFRIEAGALRLASEGDSYLIGRRLDTCERRSIGAFPYLRFVVRIGAVPRGARLQGEERDDAAFRIYAIFRDRPLRALVYVWAWELPVGAWSVRGRSLWGDFREVHRKAFGRGEPRAGQWLTVEVDLRADFQARFGGQASPILQGIALKADSNHTPGGRSVAWLRTATLHRASLREQGVIEGQALGETEVWFR